MYMYLPFKLMREASKFAQTGALAVTMCRHTLKHSAATFWIFTQPIEILTCAPAMWADAYADADADAVLNYSVTLESETTVWH